MQLNKIVVYAEHMEAYAELCAGARALADQVAAVVIGAREEADQVASYGVKTIWFGEKKQGTMLEDYTEDMAAAIRREAPELVFIKNSIRGKCIAGRLAVKLDSAVVADASEVKAEQPEQIDVKHLVYGGAGIRTDRAKKKSTILLMGAGVFETAQADAPGTVEVYEASPKNNGITCTATTEKAEEHVDLTAAKIIVGAGRGVGSKENITVLEELAKKIGGELACSRPIAEGENWMPKNRYLGVSGVIVKPNVYIAAGISGQVQHMVGVNGSKVIIAVNKDKNAPIFKNCDYGIIGDINKIIPVLTKML